MDPTKLYEEAARLHHEAKSLLEKGEKMTDDESARVDVLLEQVEAKTAEAKRLEKAAELEKTLGEPANRLGAGRTEETAGQKASGEELLMKAFRQALVRGERALTSDEAKALRADDDDAGGYLVAPQQFAAGVLTAIDNEVAIRRLATTQRLTQAASLGIVTMSDFEDFTWTTELGTGSEDSTEPFGKREMRPHPLAKRIKVSKTLLRKATQDPDGIIRDRLAAKLAGTLESAYMTGDGAQKPLGIFVASNDGIPTSRDKQAASETAFTADELIDTKFMLKAQYHPRATWIVSREFIARARKLKSTDNQYIWQPGLAGGQPSTLLDSPYVMSEFAPNTFTAGKYTAVIGDFSYYWIVDALDMQIQILTELYAETNQNGYIARYEGDGQPVLAEAFARLQMKP